MGSTATPEISVAAMPMGSLDPPQVAAPVPLPLEEVNILPLTGGVCRDDSALPTPVRLHTLPLRNVPPWNLVRQTGP